MKKVIFSMLALVSAARADSQAVGRLIDARLKLSLVPYATAMMGSTYLTVTKKGLVMVQTTRPSLRGAVATKIVTHLSPSKMEYLETLIDDARDGEVVVESPRFRCMAMSTHTETLTADNGNVFLYRAAEMCPSRIERNSSPAAESLIRELNDLYRLYISTLPVAQ